MNEIISDEKDPSISYIILYNNKSDEIARAKIDSKNIDIVKDRKWRVSKKKLKTYVVSGQSRNGRQVYLHDLIFYKNAVNKDIEYEIDHIDSESLNNMECNLRKVNRMQNCQNSLKRTDNTSGYRGVSKLSNNEFRPEIQSKKIKYSFRHFSDINEPVFVRIFAEKILHGKYSSSELTIDNIDISESKKEELKKYTIEKINERQEKIKSVREI